MPRETFDQKDSKGPNPVTMAPGARIMDPYDFCKYCGASLPPRPGEGTCPYCCTIHFFDCTMQVEEDTQMKFNSRTTLGQMPSCKQGFYLADNGEVIMLFQKNDLWYVVSFNADGFCNNAASYENKKHAWRLFTRIVQDDLENVKPEQRVAPSGDDLVFQLRPKPETDLTDAKQHAQEEVPSV